MRTGSQNDPRQALQDEISRLESKLRSIDALLDDAPMRIEIPPAAEVPPTATVAPAGSRKEAAVTLRSPLLKTATSSDRRLGDTHRDFVEPAPVSPDPKRHPAAAAPPLRQASGREIPEETKAEAAEGSKTARDPHGYGIGNRRSSQFVRWLGIGFIFAAIAGMWILVNWSQEKGGGTTKSLSPAPMADESLEQQAEAALRAFYGAGSAQEILDWVRQPEFLESRIRAHYQEAPLTPQPVEAITPLERVDRAGTTYMVGRVKLAGLAGSGRRVLVEMTDAGPRVDWDLAVNAQKAEWLAALARPEGFASAGPFRVELREAHYYTNGFGKEDWICFRLQAPEVSEPVCGYAARESSEALALASLLSEQVVRPIEVILRLAREPGTDVTPQCRVLELVAGDWISLPQEASSAEPGRLISANEPTPVVGSGGGAVLSRPIE